MSVFAILGSGFGLYGYLPALVGGCEQQVVLPERYRIRFKSRIELSTFENNVQWKQDEDDMLDCANGVVLALRPIDQANWIHHCLARYNIERIIVEKPLATSPEVAEATFNDLIHSHKEFRMAYTFRYTDWGKRTLNALSVINSDGLLSIEWCFQSHHYCHDLNNWKRFHAMGGGAIRFYGIHIIALLAEIGYSSVTFSQVSCKSHGEVERWLSVFSGSGLPDCKVMVDTRASVKRFRVQYLSKSNDSQTVILADLSDPYDSDCGIYGGDGMDRRVPMLISLCRSLWEEDTHDYGWYGETIKLWQSIESNTKYEG